MNEDTLHLLSECAAGTDMAIRSLDDVLKNSPDGPLQRRLASSKRQHESLAAETKALLRAQGFRTAAMALRDDSVRLDDPRLMQAEKLAVVMGTEGDGLADATIAACDFTVRIPMHHGVDSLNVAAASAVAFYQLGRRA